MRLNLALICIGLGVLAIALRMWLWKVVNHSSKGLRWKGVLILSQLVLTYAVFPGGLITMGAACILLGVFLLRMN